MIAGQIQIDLSRLQLGLLQTEDVCVRRFYEVQKAFAYTGAKAVYVL